MTTSSAATTTPAKSGAATSEIERDLCARAGKRHRFGQYTFIGTGDKSFEPGTGAGRAARSNRRGGARRGGATRRRGRDSNPRTGRTRSAAFKAAAINQTLPPLQNKRVAPPALNGSRLSARHRIGGAPSIKARRETRVSPL